MFSLHERIQRRVCRIAFVVCCAVPTLLTLAWVLYFHRPWQERDWQRSLENVLHVRAVATQVSAPRPLERQLASLQIVGLQSNKPLVDFDRLKFTSGDSISAEHATVHCSQLKELTQAIEIWLAGAEFRPITWRVGSLQLTGTAGQACGFTKFRAESKLAAGGVRQVMIQAESVEGQRVQLLIERTPEGKLQGTCDTQSSTLPAWLLADVVPGAARWDDARFSGMLQTEKENSEVVGTFRGTVNAIDMQKWIGADQLQSRANLRLETLAWRDHRIESAQGSLEMAEGRIHESLVQTLKEKFFCTVAPEASPAAGYFVFNRLACQFAINQQGLNIAGACPVGANDVSHCLIAAEGRPLVVQPPYNLPVAQLVQVFCPLEKSWLPATRDATNMAEKLPLPQTETKKR